LTIANNTCHQWLPYTLSITTTLLSHSRMIDDYGYSSSLLVDATIGFTQAIFPVKEDDGQVGICVEIIDLQAATEVSLTVSLDGVSSGKAGRNALCVI